MQAHITPWADRNVRGGPLRREAGRPQVDARREGGSGLEARWPEQAFRVGVGHEGLQ